MMLQPATDQPGLWINPEWREDTPGTFAVVIGVSQYAHLAGGSAPATGDESWIREARTLGQLQVSALTAFELFQWLNQAYHYARAPLAKCWLLLSPTAAERRHTPAIDQHLANPALAACKDALHAWYIAIRNLPKPVQHDSRALFFFSGHGLQVTHERQVLLPADYLGGLLPHWDDALATYNLRYGMESLEIPHRFYFIDACRNDFQAIRSKGVRGREILPENEALHAYSGIRAAAILYATAASMQSWQPAKPANGISIYGRALLDGLYGKPDIELELKDHMATVGFSKLEGFVAERVVELIEGFQSNVSQPVQPSGIVRDEVVTEIDQQQLTSLRPPGTDPFTRGPGEALIMAGARSAEDRSAALEQMISKPLAHKQSLAATMAKGDWVKDFNLSHRLFGSEQITALWNNVRIIALGAQRWLQPEQLLLHQVQHDDAMRHYQVESSVDHHDPSGYWLQLVDATGVTHACVLPADRSAQPRYLIALDLDRDTADARIIRLEAQLSLENPGSLGEAARLWQKYRHGDVINAVSTFELSALEQMVRGKLDSPLAAAVAALILLRANRLDLLHDWPRNLANWIQELPDGPIIWAEQLLREHADAAQAAEYLALILERGLPYTSEAFSYAVSLLDRLQSGTIEDQALQDQLFQVQDKLQNALMFFRPGGLFASYSHFTEQDLP